MREGAVTRDEINQRDPPRVSSGVMLVLGSLPMSEAASVRQGTRGASMFGVPRMAKHAPIFQQHAAAAGFRLTPEVALPWLSPRGHLLPDVQARVPGRTLVGLDRIFDALEGDRDRLAAKTRGSMRADFLLEPEGLHIEYDEIQHFTTARLTTLDLYPEDTVVAFSPADYRATVEMWRSKGDKAFAHKEAAEFPGRLGRQRQRAYLDAFRDLVGSSFGNRPVVRIAAPDNDYRDAVARLGRLVARR